MADNTLSIAAVGNALGWAALGVVFGAVVMLLNEDSGMPAPSTQVEVPVDTPDLTVRIEGGASGGLPPVVIGGISGGVIGVVGSVSAQLVSGRIAKGQRKDDRLLGRFDALKDAIDELDSAYLADEASDLPDTASIESFLAAERKFRRTVALVDDTEIRALAEECHRTMQSYALTRSEPDEDGATAQDVLAAQSTLFETIRDVTLKMR